MNHWFRLSLSLIALAPLLLGGCNRDSGGPSRPHPEPAAATSDAAATAPLSPDANFVDTADRAGLKFQWTHTTTNPWTIVDGFGCGCAFLDYDNDGWMDIFLVGWPRCALYHNNHDGTFTDVTAKAGIRSEGQWCGVCVGDFDNDGHEDIYVSGYGCSMLLHNNGNGTFSDITRKAGLEEKQWGSCCAFIDADEDGRLDLLVGHYVTVGDPYPWYCTTPSGVKLGCRPLAYPAQYPKLFHNNGNGTFTDVTAHSGLGAAHGKDLGVQIGDYDNDGKVDFYLSNDGVPCDLFHNLGGGKFENVGVPEGTAFNMDGQTQAGMGVDFADYDRDGKVDIVVANFLGETFSLYHNLGRSFGVVSGPAGLAVTRSYLGFGVKFLDFNDDGWPDLAFADGHVYDNIALADSRLKVRQPLLLFRNDHGHFSQVVNPGPGFTTPIVGRGMALGDVENDGSQDLLVVDFTGRPLLLHNQRRSPNHWLGVKLIGTRSNRDGYGARVTVKWPGGQSMADCSAAGSFLSSMDPRLHFGLGATTKVSEVDIRWPDGRASKLRGVNVDQYVTVKEAA